MLPYTPQPPLPPLAQADAALIDAFVEADGSLAALAHSSRTSLAALLDWSQSPAIAPWIAALADQLARHARTRLINRALHAAEIATDPADIRRAVATTIRLLYPPRSRADRASDRDPSP